MRAIPNAVRVLHHVSQKLAKQGIVNGINLCVVPPDFERLGGIAMNVAVNDLVAAVGALKTHAPLQTRVGIATGLVVVGDLIGSGASQEQSIVGETPNLAARLQAVAEPNSVVDCRTLS